MRYTEARLTRLAMEMLRDLDQDTVDFIPTYDGNHQEPLVLPARFPNLLVNGSTGIAVGMATNIPPHNLREVTDAVSRLHRRPERHGDELMRTSRARLPDRRHHRRPPGDPRRLRDRPRAACACAPAWGIEEIGQGKEALIVTELPFAVKKGGDGGLITKIADLVHDKKIPDISDLRDESDRHGMRLVIELKRGALPEGRPQPALQAHRDAVDLRREHGRAGRRHPAHAVAQAGHRRLRRAPARGHRQAHEVRAVREGAPRAHPRGPAHRDRQPRRGDRAHPRLARSRERAHRADVALRAHAAAGDGRSSTCACRS
jgi:hypothetical protein